MLHWNVGLSLSLILSLSLNLSLSLSLSLSLNCDHTASQTLSERACLPFLDWGL